MYFFKKKVFPPIHRTIGPFYHRDDLAPGTCVGDYPAGRFLYISGVYYVPVFCGTSRQPAGICKAGRGAGMAAILLYWAAHWLLRDYCGHGAGVFGILEPDRAAPDVFKGKKAVPIVYFPAGHYFGQPVRHGVCSVRDYVLSGAAGFFRRAGLSGAGDYGRRGKRVGQTGGELRSGLP